MVIQDYQYNLKQNFEAGFRRLLYIKLILRNVKLTTASPSRERAGVP